MTEQKLFENFSKQFETFVWLEHFGCYKSDLKNFVNNKNKPKMYIFQCDICKEIYIVNKETKRGFSPIGEQMYFNNLKETGMKVCPKCADIED